MSRFADMRAAEYLNSDKTALSRSQATGMSIIVLDILKRGGSTGPDITSEWRARPETGTRPGHGDGVADPSRDEAPHPGIDQNPVPVDRTKLREQRGGATAVPVLRPFPPQTLSPAEEKGAALAGLERRGGEGQPQLVFGANGPLHAGPQDPPSPWRQVRRRNPA